LAASLRSTGRGTQRHAKLRIAGQADVVGCAEKANDESTTQIAHVSVARMHVQHRRMVTKATRNAVSPQENSNSVERTRGSSHNDSDERLGP
jgi:hypothetical protein